MAVGDTYVFHGFLTPVLTLFQSNRLLFSHTSAEVRGKNTPERKVASTGGSNSQPPGHESVKLEYSWNSVMVLVHCTPPQCDLSMYEV